MRSTLRLLLPLAAVLSVAACRQTPDEVHPNEKRVVILFTTDEHSQLFGSAPELDDFILMQTPALPKTGKLLGGVARRMTVLKTQRDAAAARGVATLTLSSGDFSQGSLASAAWIATSPELAMMSRMGYDAVALGNHEFDLGPKALAAAIGAAGTALPPLVLSNIIFDADSTADDDLAALYGDAKPIAPHRVLTTSNGLRIGIVSSMGVGAGTVAGAAPPVRFWAADQTTDEGKFMSVAGMIQAAVNAVRAQGVDAVILLGHGGIATGAPATGEDEKLAQALTGVDLVLSGHSHLFTPSPRYMYGYGGSIPVVQPKPYGRNVGKIELVFRGYAPKVQLDPTATEFIDVDDRIAPTTDAAFVTDLQTRTIGALALGLRGQYGAAVTEPSFLEHTLEKITGAPVTPATEQTAPTLWNFALGKLDFVVDGLSPGETNAMNLDTDAILDAIRGVDAGTCPACAATEIAAQASGPIRGDLVPSSYEPNHALVFSDLYHVVPLGGDPTAPSPDMANPNSVQRYLNAVPGYPLVRFNVPTVMLRIVYEATLQTALLQDGDFFLGASGLEVRYDLSRTPFDTAAVNPANPATLLAPGWVTYMKLAGGTVIYDAGNAAWQASGYFAPAMLAPTSVRSIATTLYVAGFAASFGVPLYDDAGQQLASPALAIVSRPDGSHIKDYEALGQYVMKACAANAAHPGYLPGAYDASTAEGQVPRRVRNCTGVTCL